MKKITGNSRIIKEVNINLVRKALKETDQATKQQIAASTGLSTVTVGTVLQHLISKNEAFEVELSSSSGGRPAHQFKYNSDYAYVLVLFPLETKEGTLVNSTIVNLLGEVVYQTSEKVSHIDVTIFEDIIDELLLSYPNIKAIGFGLPGAEYEGKIIVSDYQALLGVSLIEHFSNKYNRTVIMENDVNAAVIGYSKKILNIKEATVIYIYFPGSYPPGAGIFINGMLYKGKSNFAGEVANIPLGIDWTDKDLYTSMDHLSEGIGKLMIATSSLLNPSYIVLHHDTLKNQHVERIKEQCNKALPQNVVPEIHLSDNFIEDYRSGMIYLTIKAIEPSITLSRS